MRHLLIFVLLLGVVGCASTEKKPAVTSQMSPEQDKLSVNYLGFNDDGIPEFEMTFQVEESDHILEAAAFEASNISVDGTRRYPDYDADHLTGLSESPPAWLSPGSVVSFRFSLDSYPYLYSQEDPGTLVETELTEGRHTLVLHYGGFKSAPVSFEVPQSPPDPLPF